MTDSYAIRPVRSDDLGLIVSHRESMFRDMGRPETELEVMRPVFRKWLEPRLADGRYFGWVAEFEGTPAAGLGMMILDWPPHPWHPEDCRRGYILNVFVEPEHRGKGLATQLTLRAEEEAKTRRLAFIVLHASPAGRLVYEKSGWKGTTEMSLAVPPQG